MHVCVYCASSEQAAPVYREAAFRLGELLATGGHTLVFGGGGVGSMGAVANGALAQGGDIIGIMPRFLVERELAHKQLPRLELVETMHERKHKLLHYADAVVALPGGCGTLEELFEALTLKRLGRHDKPIVLLNTQDFYTPLQSFMTHVVNERFMNAQRPALWQLVTRRIPCWPRLPVHRISSTRPPRIKLSATLGARHTIECVPHDVAGGIRKH